MPKKKVTKAKDTKKEVKEEKDTDIETAGEEAVVGEDSIDPSIIEDSFEEFSEYNDVDNF